MMAPTYLNADRNDMLIAAQALAHELTVVTGNIKEYSRVSGLSVEDWLPRRHR